jgi:hypothetical protein
MKTIILALAAILGIASAASAQQPLKAAFLGIHLIDTSLGAGHADEDARVRMIGKRLVEALEASGRYAFVDTAPVADKAARYENIARCNGCDADFAHDLGADVAVTGEVQKTSNLILSITVYIRDAQGGALTVGGSSDIRGNTDESWRRGIDYIVRNRLLK